MGHVSLVRRDAVAVITISQPARRNAMTLAMWREFEGALREIEADADIRALVPTGDGEAFCAGADVSDLSAGEANPIHRQRLVGRVILGLHRLRISTIARVDGAAVGAGCNLALGCDLVVASDRAKFSEMFVQRGLSIDSGGSWLLPRLVGLHRAKELCLLGDIIDAREAHALGLISRVVPAADIDSAVDELVDRLVGLDSLALQSIKRLLNHAATSSFEAALENEISAQTLSLHNSRATNSEAARATNQ